jgi:hypothetical protein
MVLNNVEVYGVSIPCVFGVGVSLVNEALVVVDIKGEGSESVVIAVWSVVALSIGCEYMEAISSPPPASSRVTLIVKFARRRCFKATTSLGCKSVVWDGSFMLAYNIVAQWWLCGGGGGGFNGWSLCYQTCGGSKFCEMRGDCFVLCLWHAAWLLDKVFAPGSKSCSKIRFGGRCGTRAHRLNWIYTNARTRPTETGTTKYFQYQLRSLGIASVESHHQ